jgi:hypothetical protein
LQLTVNSFNFSIKDKESINNYIFILIVKPEDKAIIVGMSDGLLSIKDRRKYDPNSHDKDFTKSAQKSIYNPYKYVSPSMQNELNIVS